jgi:hypothetical protein
MVTIRKMNAVSFSVSNGPKKTPSAACDRRGRFVEHTGRCERPEQLICHSQRGGQGFEPPHVHQISTRSRILIAYCDSLSYSPARRPRYPPSQLYKVVTEFWMRRPGYFLHDCVDLVA